MATHSISNEQARKVFQTLVSLYSEAEVGLLQLIAEAVTAGEDNARDHYTNQATQVRELREKARKVLDEITQTATTQIPPAMLAEYATTSALITGGPVPAGVNTSAVNVVATELVAGLTTAHHTILRSADDAYRQIQAQAVVESITGGVPRVQRIQQALNRLADRGVTGFVDVGGRRWSMDTYVEMLLRTGVTRAQNAGRLDGFRSAGVRLVLASSHKGCAPQCLPYQGRLLSLTGEVGDIELEHPDGGTVTVHVTETLDRAIENGYHHVHCRHTDTAYIPGMPMPPVVESDPEEHKILQRQRQIERHIRKWSKRQAVAVTDREKNLAQLKVRHWKAEIKKHVDSHDWLVRRPDREKIITATR